MRWTKLTPRDGKALGLIALLTAASIAFVWWNYAAAFPAASLELRYSREEITDRAKSFLRGRDLSPDNFRNLTLFDPDNRARLFLERELGLAEANRLMQGEVPVWRWRARWFQPPEREERIVWLNPAGQVIGFEHIVGEEVPGKRLGQDEALTLAREFLRLQSSEPHKLIERDTEQRPNRLDHTFTFEREDFEAASATLRRTITVTGGAVAEYRFYLHIPERWEREFAALRSKNALYSSIAQALYIPLLLAGVVVVLAGIRAGMLDWRVATGVAAVVGVLTALNQWNLIPFLLDSVPTSSPFEQTVLIGILEGFGSGVGAFLYVIPAAAAGGWLYRRAFPGKLSLGSLWSIRGIYTREFFWAAVSGYAFAAVHIAFLVGFYLVGQQFGVWSPQDVSYSSLLSTAFPWLYPLAISVFAAVSEEYWFRLLAIPLLLRLVKIPWLAIVIPALVWGFLHTNYPQQPGYIRGIEVGLIGIAAGWLMLRFGIGSTLIWHYTVDAALIGAFLFQSGSLYFQLTGLFVAALILAPLSLSIVGYWRHGGFLTGEELENSQGSPEPLPAPVAPVAIPAAPPAPVWPVRYLIGFAVLAGVVALMLQFNTYGDSREVRVSRSEALRLANRTLAGRSPVDRWWTAVTFQSGLASTAIEYLRQQTGAGRAEELFESHSNPPVWQVRYFLPSEKEGWTVAINAGTGEVARLSHTLAETAPGATLTSEQAQEIARRELAGRGIEPEASSLVNSSTERRPNRADHYFTWEQPEAKVGEAAPRIVLTVQGDEASGFGRFWKLPETWEREYRKPRIQALLLPGLAAGMAVPLVLLVLRRFGKSHLRWRICAGAGGVVSVLLLIGIFNQWPDLLASYDTARPWGDFLSQALILQVVSAVMAGAGAAAAVLAADIAIQSNLGYVDPLRPSVVKAVAVTIAVGGFGHIATALRLLAPGEQPDLPVWGLNGADTYVPAYGIAGQSVVAAMVGTAVIAAVMAGLPVLFSKARLWMLLGVGSLAAGWGLSRSLPQMGVLFGLLLLVPLMLILLWRTLGLDPVSFGVGLLWIASLPPGWDLVQQPEAFLRGNGVAAIVASVGLGLAVIWFFRRTLRGGDAADVPEEIPPVDPIGAQGLGADQTV